MKMKMRNVIVAVGALLLLLLSYNAFAAPTGPGDVRKGANDKRVNGIDNTTGSSAIVQAQAGNVTNLNINSTRLTNRWQGYYGNVTGQITLDDANNNTLYDWAIASPQGEIYAANGTANGGIVTWASVFCFNYTNNLSDGGGARIQAFNGTDIERMIGATPTDSDSVNSTFNSTFVGTFQVGSVTINTASSCMSTHLYANDAAQQTRFTEVLLSDNQSIIYTAILEQSQAGFQGASVDFEMIVGDNGESVATQPYYLFVELS